MSEAALSPDEIARLYQEACLAELRALKPGNVHSFADGHGMTVADFEASAAVSAGPLTIPGARVGARVRGAVEATVAGLGMNTNLGILLLCAPIAVAAEGEGELAMLLSETLAGLDLADAVDVFAAISRASPGGLGRAARHDVAEPPTVDLRAAMAEAAERDRIARAYITDFEDLFAIGLPALAAARARGYAAPWCATAVYLAYLARVPDTHVVRKYGPAQAESIRAEAAAILAEEPFLPASEKRLIAFDATLKRGGINPGTSADFTVATLFLNAVAEARKTDPECLAGERRLG